MTFKSFSKISILSDFFNERAISSNPSSKHFFLNESTLNFNSLFPKITFSSLRSIVQSFTGYAFGDGYDLDDIMNEGIKTLNDAANWMLHEEYSYLCFKGIVPRTRFMMGGFDWEKHDYSKENV